VKTPPVAVEFRFMSVFSFVADDLASVESRTLQWRRGFLGEPADPSLLPHQVGCKVVCEGG